MPGFTLLKCHSKEMHPYSNLSPLLCQCEPDYIIFQYLYTG